MQGNKLSKGNQVIQRKLIRSFILIIVFSGLLVFILIMNFSM